MANMIGADLEQLRDLAAAFDRAAHQLTQTSHRVRNGIRISAWVGPFAIRFRQTWDSEHSVKLRQAAAALSAQARQLRLEADQQEATSAASTALRHAGVRVSDRDLVDFAQSGTSDKPGIAKQGYTMLTDADVRALGIDPAMLHDERTGFDAKVYRDASGTIIVSFGGTELTGPTDALNDIAGINPLHESPQGKAAVDLALALENSVGADNLLFTGHSLGGRNAAIASVATGARAVTFNAAGVSTADYLFASTAGGSSVSVLQYVAGSLDRANRLTDESAVRPAPHVVNYSTVDDPLSLVQDVVAVRGPVPLPTALGEQRLVRSDRPLLTSHDDFDALRERVPDGQ